MNLFYPPYLFPGWILYVVHLPWPVIAGGVLSCVILLELLVLFFSKLKARPNVSAVTVQAEKHDVKYDDLLAMITRQNGRPRSFLFTANRLDDLPVTVPVNVAIRLAQTYTCLLIDLDTKRNAIARVFDLNSLETNGAFNISSRSTPFKNLWVWPARNFELLKQMNLRSLLDSAVKKYDYVLIYAPYLTTLPDRRQIAVCAKQAIVFGEDSTSSLLQLLEQCNCKIVKEL